MKRLFSLTALLFCITACNNSSDANNSDKKTTTATAIDSPCEILSEKEIKNALNFSADLETDREEKDITYPMCKYKWEEASFDFTMDMPGPGNRTKTVDHPAEMYVTLVKDISEKQYKQSISVYDDGVKQDDIGELATWSAKKRQVTFLKNGYLIHVYLRVSEDEETNKKQVLKMAKLYSEKV